MQNARNGISLAFRLPLAFGTLFAAAFFAYFARHLFLQYPPVWPDESLFASPAINLLHRGVLATDLFSGILPGASRCTFLQPPLYYLFLWAAFAILGVNVFTLRLASLALGVCTAVLTYFLGIRFGLGRWLAFWPVMLLLLDTVFLRGALVGRMDMLALFLIALSLVLDLRPTPSPELRGGRKPFLTGLVSGLAALAHPMGAAAPVTFLVKNAIVPGAARRRIFPPLLAGILAPFLPWLVYILRHWADFVAQFGGQILTKAGRKPLELHQLIHIFHAYAEQYGVSSGSILLVWFAGLAGLFLAARRHPSFLVLPVCQVVMMSVMIWGREIWYVLYLTPLTAIGLVCLALLAAGTKVWTRSLGWLAVLLSLWFAQKNVVHTYAVNFALNTNEKGEADYFKWCRQISENIPRNSMVLLSVIPDPYFGLYARRDLIVRQFLPKGFPVDPGEYRQWLLKSDYVVIRGPDPSGEAWDLVQQRGRLVGRVGVPARDGYYAEIYKIQK